MSDEVDMNSEAWLAQANAEIRTKPCPACGSTLASIAWEYLPTGGLLSGSQLKASVVRTLVARCSSCPAKIRATQA